MRLMSVVVCAALVVMVPSLSARTRALGTSVEDETWATIWAKPLRGARQNLLLARSRVVEHCYSEAIPPLLTSPSMRLRSASGFPSAFRRGNHSRPMSGWRVE
jgi:hypothetical protein